MARAAAKVEVRGQGALVDTNKAVYGWVHGRVQGVAYRSSLQREATRLELSGWVRNLADGRVEFFASGPAVSIDHLLTWAKSGPRFARVDQLHVEEREARHPDSGRPGLDREGGFEIRY
jgi:acylphosphatase